MNEPIPTTRDRPGSYDAIATAKPGEILFPLQGGDPFAPPTVLHWARLARVAGLQETNQEKANRLLDKARDAEQIAWQMMAYQRGEEKIEPKHARYNDQLVVEADSQRKVREALIRGAPSLHNALAEALLVADTLAKLRLDPEKEVEIREAVETLKMAAFAIEPRRGREQS